MTFGTPVRMNGPNQYAFRRRVGDIAQDPEDIHPHHAYEVSWQTVIEGDELRDKNKVVNIKLGSSGRQLDCGTRCITAPAPETRPTRIRGEAECDCRC